MDLGAPELLVILAVVLLLFGPSKLPELSKSLGKAIHEFRAASQGQELSNNNALPEPAKDQASSRTREE